MSFPSFHFKSKNTKKRIKKPKNQKYKLMSTIFCADYIVKIKCTDAVSNLLQRLQRHPPSVYKLMQEEEECYVVCYFYS